MLKLNKSMIMSPSHLEWPFGWCGHIPFVCWLIEELQPKKLVELGTHTGNSYFAMCQAVSLNNLNTNCYAVDTWQGDEHAGQYDDSIYEMVFSHNQNNYSDFSNLLRMTFDEALSKFEEKTIDLLHIDGLHTYEAVKHDFETWLPKVSDKGIILFHDTSVHDRGFGVWKLWDELKEKYPSFEFKHAYGLGVLCVGSESVSFFSERLFDDTSGTQCVRDLFTALGDHIISKEELEIEVKQLKEKNGKLKYKIKMLKNPFRYITRLFKKKPLK